MKKKDWYKELSKKYSDEELAEAYVFPVDMMPEEEKKADAEVRALRMKMLSEMTEQDRVFSDLMRLRFQIEEYVNKGQYTEAFSFSHFLNEYLRIINKTRKEFSNDLGLHYTRLSRMLTDREDPNVEITYRLEKHSGELIPAVLWWKLLVKKQEYLIRENEDKREEEASKVKNAFKFRA